MLNLSLTFAVVYDVQLYCSLFQRVTLSMIVCLLLNHLLLLLYVKTLHSSALRHTLST